MLSRSVADMLVPLVAELDDEYHQPLLFSNVTLVSEVQYSNAPEPIEVTLLGIVILVSEVQFLNAEYPIEVTLFGIVILLSVVNFTNAQSPIVVTPSGITRFVIGVSLPTIYSFFA